MIQVVIASFSGSNRFLSNFYPCRIHYDGIDYPSAEHAYVAAKTEDVATRLRISRVESPGRAKRVGRALVLRDGWDQYLRYSVMEELLALKFCVGSGLADALLRTGAAVLIEGNYWHDQVWGDCRCGGDRCAAPGMNLLGWMLMRQRAQVR